MNIEKIIGILIIVVSILTFSVQISISQLAMYIDQTTAVFCTDMIQYVPSTVYICTIITVGIGIYLIFKKDKLNKD